MIKYFLLIFFPLSALAQHIDYDSLSDQKLQEELKKELYDMQARGSTPQLIFEKYVVEGDVYLRSREAYFRFLVHTEYMFDELLATKMKNGTEKPSDFEMAEKFKNRLKQKSYQDYLDQRKTAEAKEQWENSTQDGVLKLVVDDHEQYGEAEQKRYDGLIILLNRDRYFTHLNITDGKTTNVIMPKSN